MPREIGAQMARKGDTMSETSAAPERAAILTADMTACRIQWDEARRTAYDTANYFRAKADLGQAYAEEAYLGVEDELKELAKEADDLGVYALKVKQGGY